jgi:hypothetical protein
MQKISIKSFREQTVLNSPQASISALEAHSRGNKTWKTAAPRSQQAAAITIESRRLSGGE